jgi:hypothetical protein
VVVLAREGHLARCQRLELGCNAIGPRGVATLLASPTIRAIPIVEMCGNPCDPTMQYSWDCHGTIADMYLPDEGKKAEDRYGWIPWLHPQDDYGRYGE